MERQDQGAAAATGGTALAELTARIQELEDSQERTRRLLEVVVAVGTDLDITSVLHRIVESACRISGARYAALGVLAEQRPGPRLSDFITHGISEEEAARIGRLPEGHGILGLLVDEPQSLRLTDLTRHEHSYGFPEHHPPMRTFLGVPIRVRDRVFGNLYLTEKEGGADFTETDQASVEILASAAGIAIENARLYALNERRRRWLEASAEITSVLLGRVDRDHALQLVARRAREITDSALGAVALEGDDGRLTVEVVDATEPGFLVGRTLSADSGPFADVLRSGQSIEVDDITEVVPATLGDEVDPLLASLGRASLVPLSSPSGSTGVLVVAGRRGSSWPLPAHERGLIDSFADHAALALERAQSQEDRALLAVLDDRDRIARDLHDVVIQRLFATGLQLQGAHRLAVRPEVEQRILGAVNDLDATIRDIRAAIFELHHRPGQSDIRVDIHGVVAEYAAILGFTPELEVRGPIDTVLPPSLRPQLLAVLREALSNVARHADAKHVRVEIDVDAVHALARVTDDGVGIAEHNRESGLRNLRRRAQEFGGTLVLSRNEPHGTCLQWRVDLSR